MLNTLSARQAADRAGTTVPRLLRAAKALGFEQAGPATARRKRQFDPDQVRALVARLAGQRPAPIAGLRPSEARVLAALAAAPLGLTSARAVARAAGISPATASASLTRLLNRGFVLRERRQLAEDRARERDLFTVDVAHPDWARVAPQLSAFRPEWRPTSTPSDGVPDRLGHVFWNEDLRTLDPDLHGSLIAKRVLQAKDPQALAWAAGRLSRAAWKRASQARGIDARDAALARTLASAAPSWRPDD